MVAAPGANQPRGFLLDTNVVVAVFEQEEPVLAKLEDAAAGALFVPVITLGELRFGALKYVRSRRTCAESKASPRSRTFYPATRIRHGYTVGSRTSYAALGDPSRRTTSGSPLPHCVTNSYSSPATRISSTSRSYESSTGKHLIFVA